MNFSVSQIIQICLNELEGQKRKKLQDFILSHTGPKHHTMKVYMGSLSIHYLGTKKASVTCPDC